AGLKSCDRQENASFWYARIARCPADHAFFARSAGPGELQGLLVAARVGLGEAAVAGVLPGLQAGPEAVLQAAAGVRGRFRGRLRVAGRAVAVGGVVGAGVLSHGSGPRRRDRGLDTLGV